MIFYIHDIADADSEMETVAHTVVLKDRWEWRKGIYEAKVKNRDSEHKIIFYNMLIRSRCHLEEHL